MVESNKKAENKQIPDDAESPSVKVKRNWADVEDDAEGEGAEKDIGGSGPVAKAVEEKPKFIPPKVKREKNAYGDFVVKTIQIKEKEVPKTIKNEDEEESEEEESSSEEEPVKEEEEEKSK